MFELLLKVVGLPFLAFVSAALAIFGNTYENQKVTLLGWTVLCLAGLTLAISIWKDTNSYVHENGTASMAQAPLIIYAKVLSRADNSEEASLWCERIERASIRATATLSVHNRKVLEQLLTKCGGLLAWPHHEYQLNWVVESAAEIEGSFMKSANPELKTAVDSLRGIVD